jgi:oligopeptide transport system substrate-binding protein
MMKRSLALALVLLVLLVACTPEPLPVAATVEVTREVTRIVTPEQADTPTPPPLPTAPPSTGGSTLRTALNAYPETLDPQLAQSSEEQALLQLLYEGLTRLDQNLMPQPGAAESWAASEDGKTLEFHLRAGLVYADGVPLNALRYAYALKRAIDPHTAAPRGAWLDVISGAQAWRTAPLTSTEEVLSKLEAGVSIRALDLAGKPCKAAPDGYAQADCLTLRLELDRPAPALLSVLALPVAFPARQESIEDAVSGASWWQNSRLQQGNGAFALTHLEPYVRLVFARNTNYWRGAARLSEIEVQFLATPDQALTLYRAGALDVAPLSAADLASVRDDRELQSHVQVYPGSCEVAYFFNLRKPPFDQLAVRQAVAQALDRADWTVKIDQGLGWVTGGWIPPGMPGNTPPVDGWPFDPAAARAALTQAGYPSGAGLPEIKLTYPATARGKERSEWIAAQLRANLDITAHPDPLESDAYNQAVESVEDLPQWYRVGACQSYPDPSSWIDAYFRSDSATAQLQGYANSDVDALIDQARVTYDPQQRADLYRQAHQLIVNDLPLLVMDNIANSFLVRPEVQGMTYTPADTVLPGLYEPLTIEIVAP